SICEALWAARQLLARRRRLLAEEDAEIAFLQVSCKVGSIAAGARGGGPRANERGRHHSQTGVTRGWTASPLRARSCLFAKPGLEEPSDLAIHKALQFLVGMTGGQS